MHTANGVSLYEMACRALEMDGIACPLDKTFRAWTLQNKFHIYEQVGHKVDQTPQNDVKSIKPKKAPYVATDSFLSSYAWRKLRMEALKKYGRRCMCCGATPESGAVMNVDHIKPRKLWPSLALDINNLQILCHECNHGKGNWDQTDWRKKTGTNPAAIIQSM